MQADILQTTTYYKADGLMQALSDFFNDDWLPEQLAQLERWRDYILKNDYYVDAKGNPGGLLTFYELNVSLIEAMWELFKHAQPIDFYDSNTIATEQVNWRDYPKNLSEQELIDPLLVITFFFKDYSVDDYRKQLREWLEHGLNRLSADGWINAGDIVRVYENLQKLYSAAWIIYQRSSDTPHLNNNTTIEPDIPITVEQRSDVSLYRLNNVIPSVYNEILKELVKIIVQKVPLVQCVFYLGVRPDIADSLFLFLLTSDKEDRQAFEIANQVEESCRPVAKVTMLVHHASMLFTAIKRQDHFFNHVLSCPVVYLSGELLPPAQKPDSSLRSEGAVAFNWDRWKKQGDDFLSGASHHMINRAYNAALFCLHQCAECFLIALVRGVLDYRVNNHNLSRLLSISKMFTADLSALFDLDDASDKELFDVLKNAYVNVRYRDHYEADAQTVEELEERVRRLVEVCQSVYAKHLLSKGL